MKAMRTPQLLQNRILKYGKTAALKLGPWSKINNLREELTSLGLEEPAYRELEKLTYSRNTTTRRLACWNLALWHADKSTQSDAKLCLEFLNRIPTRNMKPDQLARVLVLQLEAHVLLGRPLDVCLGAIQGHLKAHGENSDLYLALASASSGKKEKVQYINRAFSMSDVQEISLSQGGNKMYDKLYVPKKNDLQVNTKQPLVTVIVPAFNAAETLPTALDSIISQTWTNLEVIVANDCSTDSTRQVAESYEKRDSRIKIVDTPKNSGAYISRNVALQSAAGEFVTCNDSDDWSHPEKIERQVSHLLKNPEVIANASELARARNDLTFYRRGLPGEYIQVNISSLMFRRKPVMKKLGYWDSVRFGADSEFIKRLRLTFGESSVVFMKNSLYSFLRQTEGSLTSSSAFGYPGFMMGARREYAQSQDAYYSSGESLRFDYPMKKRPFAVPYPMLPDRKKAAVERQIKTVIAADMRRGSRSVPDVIEYINHKNLHGHRLGFVQLHTFGQHTTRHVSHDIRRLVDGHNTEMIVYGEDIKCDELIIFDSGSLEYEQKYIPNIQADRARITSPSEASLTRAKNNFHAKKWL